MTKIAVAALGGNALTRAGQSGSSDEMMANAAAMATAVNDVIEAGWRVVIVHGNGPQVGNLALQQEAALRQEATAVVPAQPLALLGAMTQGMLGSLIARAIDLLRGRGTAAALVTHVTVDPADPAFGTLIVFNVDFDAQKDVVRRFRAQMQSTLIAFKGTTETARSVGDTDARSIEALIRSTLG